VNPNLTPHRPATTMQVNNTDAEGRLTLADALVYAEKTAGAKSTVSPYLVASL